MLVKMKPTCMGHKSSNLSHLPHITFTFIQFIQVYAHFIQPFYLLTLWT